MAGAFKWHSCSTKDFPLKRNKVTKACNACRTKKMRCDGITCLSEPRCARCTEHSLLCHYDEKTRRNSSPKKPDLLKRDGNHVATVEHDYKTQNLKNITFSNHYYTHLSAKTTNRPFLYITRLPPLLFGFFDMSSQPHTVWAGFLDLFTQYLQASPTQPGFSRLAKDLSLEILSLFSNYNLLYSPCIEISLINTVINSIQNPLDPSVAPTKGVEIVLTFSVFALVFQAANQALCSRYQKLSLEIERLAHIFYSEAHRRLLSAAFPFQPLGTDRDSLIVLIQSAILLTHYQCTTVCEEQAFITLQIGATFAQRCSFQDLIRQQKTDLIEKEKITLLFKLLHSWDVWFSVYMRRNCWTSRVQNPEELAEPKTIAANKFTNDQEGYQQWAVSVLDQYTEFLSQLTTKQDNSRVDEIKAQLSTLSQLSNLSKDVSNFNDICGMKLSVSALELFHQILTIQIFNCQLKPSSDQLLEGLFDLAALDSCVSAARCIVQSSKTLASTSNTSPAIVYALCVAKSIFDLKEQEQNSQSKRLKQSPLETKSLTKKVLHSEISTNSNEVSILHVQLLEVIKILSTYSEIANTLEMCINHKVSADHMFVHTAPERCGENPDLSVVPSNRLIDTDDNLHCIVSAQPRSANQAISSYLMLDVMSRADMDKEQLSKLSHTSIEREEAASVSSYYSGSIQASINKRRHMTPGQDENTNKSTRAPKRQLSSPGNNDSSPHHQLQQAQPHYSYKRTKTSNLGNNDQEMTVLVGPNSQNQQQQQKEKNEQNQKQEREQSFERGLSEQTVNSHNPYVSMHDVHEVHEDSSGALGICNEDYLWIDIPISDTLQAEQPQHHQHFYPSTQTVKHRSTRISEVSPTPELPSMSSTSTTPGSGIHAVMFEAVPSLEGLDSENSVIPPKLPLPPPKHRDAPQKYWPSVHSRDWNECFTASMVETLHPNTSVIPHEPSFGTPIVQSIGLDTLSSSHEHHSSLVPQTAVETSVIPDADSSEMMYLLYGSSENSGSCGERSSAGSSDPSPRESVVCHPPTNWLSSPLKHTSPLSTLSEHPSQFNAMRQSLESSQQDKSVTKQWDTALLKAPEYKKKANRDFAMLSTNSMAPNHIYPLPIDLSPTPDQRSVVLQSRLTTSGNSSCQHTEDGSVMFSQENPWIQIPQTKIAGDAISWH
ncbi:Zn(2)-C6 fungal-specific transcription factor [Phycomyces blakesleeanus NRRL 1555(-)]|uniref:Zn(2)-C6 fungal-specific transcription factor n=1 Tax=Phycomyces blakesleeanus (strain ATCC 8743b / DSM 1359 / FGSC 10004 / NBRC 33097 / NRRL 1555) TaxID=763407 RepID=A0A162ZRX3_PHYB8|nr:Zn(2)-C6 fungal-specific transcription factor [Phycomyces blakesleeanus NRRL 1555(-)]OAD68671.1 Zn(2)-C6 fungal-specific transcription factor [Phycomyces blakesleeanus NRRL 1555(-)]|eukprot:XP_018286711.1 Zn(2)-C6 fungal-specific transcription factor [Phycomyces blakesleeanus NRRL 1555(-)]